MGCDGGWYGGVAAAPAEAVSGVSCSSNRKHLLLLLIDQQYWFLDGDRLLMELLTLLRNCAAWMGRSPKRLLLVRDCHHEHARLPQTAGPYSARSVMFRRLFAVDIAWS